MDSIKVKTPANRYKAIADAIRKKNNTTELMHPADMPKAILDIVGGITFNIAYGETAPEDTSKLWIKANEPENVSVGSDIEGVESIGYMDVTLPESLSDISCAKVGNNVYIFGDSSAIYKFNMETNEFTKLTATYTYYDGVGVAVVGTKIYLFAGQYYSSYYRNTTGIYVFDTETETITTVANFSSKQAYMSCVAVGNKIYIFGGNYNVGGSVYFEDAIYVFDCDTHTLTTLVAKLPFACGRMGSALVGNKIYLFGGKKSESTPYYTDKICVFDIETLTLTQIETVLPTALCQMGCGVIGTKIYLFGGKSSDGTSTIYVFDTETETITTLDTTLLITLYGMGTVTIGNKIYLFGGWGDSYTIKVFALTHELAKGDIEIQSGLLNNKFKLINTDNAGVEIGVENVFIGNDSNEAELCEAYLHNGIDWAVI